MPLNDLMVTNCYSYHHPHYVIAALSKLVPHTVTVCRGHQLVGDCTDRIRGAAACWIQRLRSMK